MPGDITTDDGTVYDGETYHVTSKQVGKQQWVANQWADGALPLESRSDGTTLRSKSGNLKGFQRPDGSGKLRHYRHIEAIRTKSGLIISDTSCYAKGMARCATPNTGIDHRFDVTSLKKAIRGDPEKIREITDYDNGTVTFESGRKFDLEDKTWLFDAPAAGGILGE